MTYPQHVASQLWLGGGGVCPDLTVKGRRGRVIATLKPPVTRVGQTLVIFYLEQKNGNER